MNYAAPPPARDLTVVILAYGADTKCNALLSDLLAWRGIQIVVVHNPSHPGQVLDLKDNSSVILVQNSSNLGYAEGMNVGIMRALDLNPKYVLILTHDVRIDGRSIDALRDALAADGDFAAVGPVLSSPEGVVFSTGMIRAGPTRVRHRLARHPAHPIEPWLCDGLDGSAILWRASALRDLVGFDSRFFMYMEDIELCARARRNGWKVGSVNAALAVSIPGGTQRRAAHAYLRARNGLESARLRGARYVVFELLALMREYWTTTPKPGGTRFGRPEHRRAAKAFRMGATLGIVDFVRRRWGPPPIRVLRDSDIGSTAKRAF